MFNILYIYICIYCRAKAKDCNFNFGRKLVMYVFGTVKTSFQDIKYIQRILSQFRCFSEKIMGCLNCNCEKPRRTQCRTPNNTSYASFTLSYCVLPLFNCTSNMKLPSQLGVIRCSAFVYVKYEVTVTAWSYTAFCPCLTARQIWSYRHSLELYCVLSLFCTSNMKLPSQLGVILCSVFV